MGLSIRILLAIRFMIPVSFSFGTTSDRISVHESSLNSHQSALALLWLPERPVEIGNHVVAQKELVFIARIQQRSDVLGAVRHRG